VNKNSVLIIGASSDIGREIIREISDADTTILAHYNTSREGLEKLQSEVEGQVVLIQADLSSASGIEGLLTSVEAECQFPQKIVFLAAQGLKLTRFKDLTWEDFEVQLKIQLRASFEILKRYLPGMSAAKGGRVVFVLSSCTLGVPPSAMAQYVTAKYALLGLMRSLSAEYAGKQVCINAVSPSMIETDFLSEIPRKIVEITAQEHPRGRNGGPSDVAPVVSFLLSDGAGYMTGVNLPVTGGA
jgi:3-oxoacyl-[acyl-carrier protein] reductase